MLLRSALGVLGIVFSYSLGRVYAPAGLVTLFDVVDVPAWREWVRVCHDWAECYDDTGAWDAGQGAVNAARRESLEEAGVDLYPYSSGVFSGLAVGSQHLKYHRNLVAAAVFLVVVVVGMRFYRKGGGRSGQCD